ncbi:uncharacterized protein LY79DRAFT_573793 [Colletotrichum navitas]|uniref:Uncharacterized protein n=1 Tax=Colletotrichum navitas TaxID=681940 RepID=A0AAD8PJF6_9PEZI|nr:uncharacterized protein LY79DRAFT_573793 [Colletotrichum navitas]KAK1564031.1 hypothetical protein LY79DRAFT_573793 [Colletotrichum navitas]
MDRASSDSPPFTHPRTDAAALSSPPLPFGQRPMFSSALNPSHSVPPHSSARDPSSRAIEPPNEIAGSNRTRAQAASRLVLYPVEGLRRSHLSPPSPRTWETFSVVPEEGVRENSW